MKASPESQVIAIVGAESTGKTTLAAQLAQTLRSEGLPVALVDEYLREFCAAHGRTPQRHEQAAIAHEQSRRIDAAAVSHSVVIADTTALMIAVYSDHVFGDSSLYEYAERVQGRYATTLLTALDLPWVADGLQRDGPHVREPIDAMVRASLARANAGYAVIGGSGDARLAAGLAAVNRSLQRQTPSDTAAPRQAWQWVCERCSDGSCERHLLARG